MLKIIESKNLEKKLEKKYINKNKFSYKKSDKITKHYYDISIPEEIIKCYDFVIKYSRIEFEETLIKYFNNKKMEVVLNDYNYFYEIGTKENTASIITTNIEMNENIFNKFMKSLYKAFVFVQLSLNEKVIEKLTAIEELNLNKYCSRCKFYILCKEKTSSQRREEKKCWYLFELLDHTQEEINNIKVDALDYLKEYLIELQTIESIRKFFPIKTTNNKMLKKFSAENIKKTFENEELSKMQFYKVE